MKRKTYYTDLICPECGKIQVIYRRRTMQKKIGHIKDLWCPNCQKVCKFIELRDRDICYYKLLLKEQLSQIEEQILTLLDKRQEMMNNGKIKRKTYK